MRCKFCQEKFCSEDFTDGNSNFFFAGDTSFFLGESTFLYGSMGERNCFCADWVNKGR